MATPAAVRWIVGFAVLAVVAVLFSLGESIPPPLARGMQAPAFSLPQHGAEAAMSLEQQRGRVVLLNFWATWCKPCEDEMPAMERLYRELGGPDFEMLAVSVDEDEDLVARFRERMGLSFPILLDPSQEISRLYQTTGFPESLLVDRQGRIVERYVGPRDWDASIFVTRIRDLMER